MNPLDLTPRNGDFAAYIDALLDGRQQLPGARRPDPGVEDTVRLQRLTPQARAAERQRTGAAGPYPVGPGATAQTGANAGAARYDMGLPSVISSPSATSAQATPTASLGPTSAPGEQMRSGPPDLSELFAPVLIVLQRLPLLLAVGAVLWWVLGMAVGIAFFAQTMFMPILLIIAAIFVHNGLRKTRRNPTPARR